MAIQKTQAIVLKKFDFRDTSLIVTCFTRDFGKLKGVVKGVRKEGNADLAHFELLNHLSIVFYEKSRTELHLLSESFLEDPMLSVRNSFKTYIFGCYLAELVDHFYEIHEVAPRIFDSFLSTLKQMTPETVSYQVLVMELGILKEAGLFPELKVCLRCGKSGSENRWLWSPRQGGILCEICSHREAKVFEVSPEMYSRMQDLETLDASNQIYGEIEKLVREFIRERVETPIRSAEFLRAVDSFRSDFSVKDPQPA